MAAGRDSAALTAAALRVAGVGPARLRTLLDAHGTLEAGIGAALAGGAPPPGWPAAVYRDLPAALDVTAAARELAQIRRGGVDVVCWEEARYPAPLWLSASAPPPLLYVQGALPATFRRPAWQVRAAAVVGTRKATGRGLALARELARALAELDVVVVSGLALGIDGAAHDGALAGNGPTVAVLGGGHGHLHPPSHRPLAARILASGGAVLSEHPPDVQPEPHFFPARNRIISGLARVVVIVEAGLRSGANATARYACEQHRDVFAGPGRPGDPSVAGTLQLIRDGALVLTELEDVLGRFRSPGGAARPRDRAVPAPPSAAGGMDAAVLDALYGLEEATLDQLAAALTARAGAGRSVEGASVSDVAGLTARLTRLELAGRVHRTAAGRFRLPARERERRAAEDRRGGGTLEA